jgi:hypothetical protein
MKRSALLAAALACGALNACTPPSTGGTAESPSPNGTGATLRAFRSDAELVAFHRRILEDAERRERKHPTPPPPPPAPPAPSMGEPADPAATSITNVQHAGVDEGGIVKLHGDHLVILRRGRLFTVRIGGDALQPVSAVDAFGPGIDPQGTWYDEILISGDNVAVIGYSYRRGGTEVGLFRVDAAGGITPRGTFQVRSGDYYSSRNYASRLIGSRLIFYSPIRMSMDVGRLEQRLPAFRRWSSGDSTWRRTAPPTRVYRAAGGLKADDGLVLHTVTTCDLASEDVECESTALYGPSSREFYVSPHAVYVWATTYVPWYENEDADDPGRSVLYRMPLDGGAPTGIRAVGQPIDQFSFLESGDSLNVLLRLAAREEAPWGGTTNDARARTTLLRLPVSALGDGSRAAGPARYRWLPTPGEGISHNRFVRDWLLYGYAGRMSDPRAPLLYGVHWAGNDSATVLRVPHGVERIEVMGSGAVVVGSSGRDLLFSGIRLGPRAEVAGLYTRPDAQQGESRSQGFFYRPDGTETGLLGLPIRTGSTEGYYPGMNRGSARVVFVRNQAFRLTEMGDLAAAPGEAADDACRASCVDWYGNARPLFIRGRIFALMGYELVEGREDDGRIREVRRVSFAPTAATAAR